MRAETLARLGTVLGVWAHPDDEAFLAAGLMGHARDAGNRVVVATATYGERGGDDLDEESLQRLAAMRARELAESLAAVGVHEHRFLGFADGACAGVPEATGVAAVAELIEEVRPATIVTFGPEGMTGHSDHVAVSGWVTAAWRETGRSARLLYATLTPHWHERWGATNDRVGLWMSGRGPSTASDQLALTVHCEARLGDRKLAALRAHASQTAALVDAVGEDTFRQWWSREYFAEAPEIATATTTVSG